MTKTTLKTLALVVALFSLAVAKETKFTDKRDGKVYATTKIGKQVWMAENLNYATDSSYCYQDDPANCAKYGRLYTWDAAMKACPTGWHLPTREEWNELEETLGENVGTKLKSKEMGGTDAFGFNALPADGRGGNGAFFSIGSNARFWAATEYDDKLAHNRYLRSDMSRLGSSGHGKRHAFSVRCVKD